MNLTRQSLLRNAGGLASLSMFANPALAAILRQRPELILHNGHVLTMDGRQPQAEAIAIADGRILAVGSDIDILDFAGGRHEEGRPRRQDGRPRLHRRALPPGLFRPAAPALHRLRPALHRRDPGRGPRARREDAAGRMGRRLQVRRHQDRGEALHHARGPRRRRAEPSRCTSRTAAGIPATSIPWPSRKPASPRSRRTPRAASSSATRKPGKLTGRLLERAAEIYENTIPAFGTTSRDEDRAAIKLITQMFAKAGVTSSTDAYGSPDDLRAYQDAREAGELASRIYCMIGYTHLDRMIASGVRTGFGDEWIRVGGMKATCDGSISERTARLSQALRRAAERLRHDRRGCGGTLLVRAQGARRRLAGRHPRERRRRHRHGARPVRAAAARAAAPRPALPHRALHGDQRRPGAAHEGARRDPDAVLDLRVLPRREDAGVRRGAARLACSRSAASSTPASGRRWPRTTRPAPSSR